MTEETVAYDQATRTMLLDLFTEVAILEHLVRFRFKPDVTGDLSAKDFGVLNHLVRLNKVSEKLATLAWSFQTDLDDMRITVHALAKRKLVEIDWVDGGECVFMTDAGRRSHDVAVDGMAPEVFDIVSEIDPADLRTTAETLKEIRRTFDNLPDR